MSRIGKTPIQLPKEVTCSLSPNNILEVRGPKGILRQPIHPDITVEVKGNIMSFTRPTEQKRHKALHGLARSLAFNAIQGVTQGYKKILQLVGVGYKVTRDQNVLEINVGRSHNIYFVLPKEVSADVKPSKGQDHIILLESIYKQLLGEVAAKLRSLKKPDPYKVKGISYVDEKLRRKAGKTATKK